MIRKNRRDEDAIVKTSQGVRALAARVRHLAENVVTDREVVQKLLAYADELDEDARRMEAGAELVWSAPGENVSGRST
jgi:hypothetical protein